MRARRVLSVLLVAATLVGYGATAKAQVYSAGSVPAVDGQNGPGELPNRLQGGVGVIERLGELVSPETEFVDSDGQVVTVGSVLGEGKPVVIAYVYHNCPMLCSLVLDGLADAIEAETDLRPGTDYTAVALSFDPRDTPELAASVKRRYVEMVGDSTIADGWHFWTGTEDAIETLTSETGFEFAWDAQTEEFAHGAVLTLLSPDGVVTRYLYGVQPSVRDYRLGLVEAGQGTVGTTLDRFLLTCYQFDPDTRSYSLAILGVMKWGGGILLLAFGGMLVWFWRRESARQTADTPAPDLPGSDLSGLPSGATS